MTDIEEDIEDSFPEPSKGEIIEDQSLSIKVIEVNGKDFKAKVVKIKDSIFNKWLEKGKTYNFTRFEISDNVWQVDEKQNNKDYEGYQVVCLFSWPEGYSFEAQG